MDRNFTVEQEIELQVGEEWFDLKNVYFFHSVALDAASGRVRLIFEGHSDSGQPDVVGKKVAVCFDQLTYFTFSEGFASKVNTELSRIGFKNPTDFDDDWLLSDEQSDAGDHLLFCLSNDEFIRAHANKAVLERL